MPKSIRQALGALAGCDHHPRKAGSPVDTATCASHAKVPKRGFMLVALLLGGLGVGWASDGFSAAWTVEGAIAGRGDKVAKDLSGIASPRQSGFPRAALMIDDESQSVTHVRLQDGKIEAGGHFQLIHDQFQGEPLELDAEGVAYGRGCYYVTGSYGAPRNDKGSAAKRAARIRACSRLVSIGFDNCGPLDHRQAPRGLRELILQDPALEELRPSLDRALEDNGLTVEGLAFLNDRLYFGLRSPTTATHCMMISAPVEVFFENVPIQDVKLHKIPVKQSRDGRGQGIRDLTPLDNHLLVLLGPSVSSSTEDFDVASWNSKGESSKYLRRLPSDPVGRPEGLLVLDSNAQGMVRVLVLLDGLPNGSPRTFEIPMP